jgi:hypothetical protein
MKFYLFSLIAGISLFGSFSCKKSKMTPKPVTVTLIADPQKNPGTVLVSSDNIVRDTSDELNSFAWTENGNPVINRTIFTFNLANIPSSDSVYFATLSLYYDSTSTSTAGQSNMTNSDASLIQRVTTSWDAATTIWANQPQTTSQNEAYLTQSTSISEDYPNIDVTGLVQDMIRNPSSSFGFEIRLANEQPYCELLFCSAYYAEISRRPHMEIKYGPK